jgi:hypothetical protein
MTQQDIDEKFTGDLIKSVISKLTGSHKDYERLILPNYPQKLLILGSLSEEDPNFVENESTSVKSNSLTIMFITKDKVSIKVRPKINLYYGVKEEEGELEKLGLKTEKGRKFPYVWKKIKTNYPFFELNEKDDEVILDFKEYISEINNDLEHESVYDNKMPKYEWSGKIKLEINKHPMIDGAKIVKIQLINTTKPVGEKETKYDTSFFDTGLDIEKVNLDLIEFIDKRKNDFNNINEIKSIFKTFNCGWEWTDQNKIRTLPYKIINQIKMSPLNTFLYNGEEQSITFKELSNSYKLLDQLYDTLKIHSEEYKDYLDNNEDLDAEKVKEKYEYVISRFKEGIEILNTDESANKAFKLMQETFHRLTENKDYHGWRIFQIVFIVSLIPDIIDKEKRRNEIELLHVATGGGKSESYFGLVVFSAFYDRLTGKSFGTTAITKFPLRMLSVDQLQRIADIFIFAEEIRKEKIDNEGDSPFSVAYFVGSSDEFPRKTKKIIEELQRLHKDGSKKPGKIITNCPICESKGKDQGKNTVFLNVDKNSMKILHHCDKCNKDFELFFTDEEIYRFLPTFIISTVDKFAGISLQRRFKNIFGGKLNKCTKGHGFIPRGDFCEVDVNNETCKDEGDPFDINFCTTPSLIIQDEMHLIREGFGTIESHFETFIENLSETINHQKFKHITMTATIKGADQQNKTIYWKDKTNIFPWYSPLGKGIKDPFYLKKEGKKQRIIIGLKPNFRDNQYATLITLRYLTEFINDVESNIDKYSKKYGINNEELNEILIRYKCLMTYHNKKSDVNSMNFYMSAVVNSKLSNIDYSINHNILTGDNTLDEIRDQIQYIKNFDGKQKKMSALSCTSIVSHGVDISRWNFMCFQGIPGSTAEYIQALSRVGRKDMGIIFLWFYPNRVRDISFYDNFIEFNQQIDLFVESVPIERWTKLGFQQTFHSLFCGAILNYMSFAINKPIYNVKHIIDVFFTNDDNYNDKKKKELISFLEESYHVRDGMPNSNFMIQMIAKETNERLKYLYDYFQNKANDEKVFFPNVLINNDKKYWKNQFGMRGIQDTVGLANYQETFIRRYKNG